MAKITLTLEDRPGGVTLSLDQRDDPAGLINYRPTPAMRLSRQLFDVATYEATLSAVPAHRLQPTSQSRH